MKLIYLAWGLMQEGSPLTNHHIQCTWLMHSLIGENKCALVKTRRTRTHVPCVPGVQASTSPAAPASKHTPCLLQFL